MHLTTNYDNIVGYMDRFMKAAIEEARIAYRKGEIPIGAVIVKDNRIIAKGHNMTEELKDPTAHAEMIAMRKAAEYLGGWRLLGCSMYVTIEPCSMCAGAMVWARIEKLYIGSMDPKSGACGSVMNIPQNKRLNHYIDIQTGIMKEECESMMKDFFKDLRQKKSEERKL